MKKTDLDQALVVVQKKDWEALVHLLREEEKTLKASYNTPGKNDWETYYKDNHPQGWAIYQAARNAAKRKPRSLTHPSLVKTERRFCYEIIGHYTGKVIGHCWGEKGKEDALRGEPKATFRRISEKALKAWERKNGEFGERAL